jgi:hypothetical protein
MCTLPRKVLIISATQQACLIIGPRRVALIGAIAAVALAIIFYPLIVFTPIDTEKVDIKLTQVALASGSIENQNLDLRVTVAITNTNDMTLTTSRIDYELFADGALVGTDQFYYEDVPVNGRPALFPQSSVPLSETFRLEYTDEKAEIFNKILADPSQIEWRMQGSANIESGTTFVTKTFSTEL